jgi:hypothetical protein
LLPSGADAVDGRNAQKAGVPGRRDERVKSGP